MLEGEELTDEDRETASILKQVEPPVQKTEVQKTEDRRQRTEDRGQGFRGQRTEDRGQ
jgi:hypothetical protein